MSISAIVPYASIIAVNAQLEELGFGPNNFSVPAYVGVVPSFGALHAWDDPRFLAALEAIPEVTVVSEDGDPVAMTNDIIIDNGAQWPAQAPPLPESGMVLAGEMYSYGTQVWSIIQSFDRSTYGGPPEALPPAIIRYVRPPGSIEPWKQPIDQYDAYKLLNPYTGAPDECYHNLLQWYVTQADGAGNNVYEPGVYGWAVRTAP